MEPFLKIEIDSSVLHYYYKDMMSISNQFLKILQENLHFPPNFEMIFTNILEIDFEKSKV